MAAAPFTVERGDDSIIATAIHAGHDLRTEVQAITNLSEADRLREEDPFTDRWVGIAANRIVARRSRFEVDLNRSRDSAVYREPADAWGLDLWKQPPAEDLVADSLAVYDSFYDALGVLCDDMIERNGQLVVLDLHSYNHRRNGPDAPAEDPLANPEINIGTSGIHPGWGGVVDALANAMASGPFLDRTLDVRFDIKFTGGHMMRWLNERYDGRCCAIAIEMKKIYMDEWTGEPDEHVIGELGRLLDSAAEAVRAAPAVIAT